jgi:hypothetical protein
MKNILFSVLIYLLGANLLQATIRKVPQQYQTIPNAITASNNADTILVDKGTYSLQLFISKPLSIIGVNEDSVIVTWNNGTPGTTGKVVHIDSTLNVTLQRMTVVGKDAYMSLFQGAESALEISSSQNVHLLSLHLKGGRGWDAVGSSQPIPASNGGYGVAVNASQDISLDSCVVYEIGRASCRERVSVPV